MTTFECAAEMVRAFVLNNPQLQYEATELYNLFLCACEDSSISKQNELDILSCSLEDLLQE